jgi:argininosuccinate lyase
MSTHTGSDDKFPAPVFKDTVLAPLFEGAKSTFVDAFRRVDRAHCVMLAETGILKPDQAKAIAKALAATEKDLDLKNTTYTGEVEDLFFLIEHALKEKLPADLAGRLHTGRSRNDIDHTLFKMVLKQRIDTLFGKAGALARALIDKAEAEKSTIIVAYTHGQPAQPTTFGHYLSAAIEILLGDIERMQSARVIVDQSSMGAAAITTTGFPLDRARIAELLGFGAVRENSYGCIAAVDYVTAPYSALKLMMLHLGRLIQDLQFWSSFEVGQLHVPDGYVQISSIMPQKRNPVPIEHSRLLASLAVGRAETAIMTMHNTPFTDMNDSEGEVQGASHAAFVDAGRAIDLLAGVLRAARIDAARVAINLDRSCATITELADSLVRREGLSFRQAHEIAAHVARAVVAAKTPLSGGYTPFSSAFQEIVGGPTKLSESEFKEFVSPEYFIAVRDRFGGPAPAALAASIARYRQRLTGFEAGMRVTAAREAAAARALDAAFAKLTA